MLRVNNLMRVRAVLLCCVLIWPTNVHLVTAAEEEEEEEEEEYYR